MNDAVAGSRRDGVVVVVVVIVVIVRKKGSPDYDSRPSTWCLAIIAAEQNV